MFRVHEPRFVAATAMTLPRGGGFAVDLGLDDRPATGLLAYLTHQDEHLVLRLDGELDLATTGHVREAANVALRASDHPQLDIDLTDLRFVDSSGLHVLLDVQADGGRRGGCVRLTHATPAVRRLFSILGCENALTRTGA